MAYFIDLFSPETYEAFTCSPRDISGFRLRHKNMAARIKPGDVFVCYLTRLSRWFGLLEVIEGPFIDDKPIFLPVSDPFVVRFRVRPSVWLDIEKSIPIHDEAIWAGLSFTRTLEKGSIGWTGKVRGSLVRLEDRDGQFLAERLTDQMATGKVYPIDEQDARKLATHTVIRPDKVVAVSIPEGSGATEEMQVRPEVETRESIRVQALIATIGARMGMSIWIPRADRGGVLTEWKNEGNNLLERLPLNYDDTTLRTIEQIDVLWLRGRSIIRGLDRTIRLAPACAVSPNHGPSRIEIEVIGEGRAAGLNHLPWLKTVRAASTEKHGDGRAAHALAIIRDRPGRCVYRSRKDVIGSKYDPNGADGAIDSRQHGHGH